MRSLAVEVPKAQHEDGRHDTQWLAQRPCKKEDLNVSIDRLVGLWAKSHLLASQLVKPGTDAITLETSVKSVSDDLEWIDGEYRKECTRLQDQALATQWREIEAALTVPWMDSKMRMDLLMAGQRISKKLFDEYDAKQTAPPGATSDLLWEARRQGRLAVAALGQPWIDQQVENQKVANITFKELNRMVEGGGQEAWWTALHAAGAAARAGLRAGPAARPARRVADARWRRRLCRGGQQHFGRVDPDRCGGALARVRRAQRSRRGADACHRHR